MRFPYSEKYDPPAPIIRIILRSPAGESLELEDLIDSGADITVFPREVLGKLVLIPGSTVLVRGI